MLNRTIALTMLSLFAISACKDASSSNSSRSASAPATANTNGSVANGSGSIVNAGGTGAQGAVVAAGTGPGVAVQPGMVPAPSTGTVSPGPGTAGGATGFAIACANGAHLNGNYQTNAAMCQALQAMANTCAESQSFYQQNCAPTAGNGVTPGAQSPAPASGGTLTSFNVNCANGSNYNGSFPNHQTMCAQLAAKIPNCPVEALAVYNQLCR